MAGVIRNRADATQQQAAQQNASDQTALISELQRGKVDPAIAAHIYANPMASPESRALITHLISPKPIEDVNGRPAYASPSAGIQAAPINGPFQPGIRIPEAAGGASTTTPLPAPPMPNQPVPTPAPPQVVPRPPVAPTSKVWGDKEGEAAGIYPPSAPAPAPAPSAATDVPNFNDRFGAANSRLSQLAAMDRDFSAKKVLTQAGATAQGEGNQEDVRSATAAPTIIKGLGLIKSTIQSSPGVTFGPTAGWSADVKRVIANYAPGLSDEKSLAGADAIEKLNFGLASQLAKTVGGTQGELFKAIGSTPGTEKSKQGTLALIDMMQQDQLKSQQLGGVYRQYEQAGRLQDYPAAREQFLTQHPTINPLSGQPIEMDIAAARKASAANPPAGVSGPPVGTMHNGYRFKGGNPNDKANWEAAT